MRIHEFVWPQDRVDPIARHGVTPEEDRAILLHLEAGEVDAIRKIARSKGVADTDLIREWVPEKLQTP